MKYFFKIALLFTILVVSVFFIYNSFKTKSTNEENKCGRLPGDNEIKYDNKVWQVLQIPKGNYKLMNAYVDDRENITRVLLIGPELDFSADFIYCQFWFDDSPDAMPFIQRATKFFLIWNEGECFKIQ